MSDYMDKVRLVAARMEGEKYPTVIGAIAETTWEIIPPEDWDRVRNGMAEQWLGPDWAAYDFVEFIAEIPNATIGAMFDARSIGVVPVSKGDDDGVAENERLREALCLIRDGGSVADHRIAVAALAEFERTTNHNEREPDA